MDYSLIFTLILLNLLNVQGEKGICSWYGVNLDNQFTANGEKYEHNLMTAAHKTLPFGTIVTATCAGGKSVTVRINDRGPFVAGRILDLSIIAGTIVGIYPDKGLCDCEIVTRGTSNTNPPSPHMPSTTPLPPITKVDPHHIDCSVADKRIPDPNDCTKYYWCYGGQPHELQCNGGLWWDPDRNLCDYPKNIKRPGCK